MTLDAWVPVDRSHDREYVLDRGRLDSLGSSVIQVSLGAAGRRVSSPNDIMIFSTFCFLLC